MKFYIQRKTKNSLETIAAFYTKQDADNYRYSEVLKSDIGTSHYISKKPCKNWPINNLRKEN